MYLQNLQQHWNLSNIHTGHQPFSQTTGSVVNLSCGFWASFYTLLTMIGTPIPSKVGRQSVVDALRSLVCSYQDETTGGMSQHEFISNVSEFVPNLQARFMLYDNIEIVSDSWPVRAH
jgi:hypothetical protein